MVDASVYRLCRTPAHPRTSLVSLSKQALSSMQPQQPQFVFLLLAPSFRTSSTYHAFRAKDQKLVSAQDHERPSGKRTRGGWPGAPRIDRLLPIHSEFIAVCSN